MPREIPGFIYDADRGRYFRVQENHQNAQHVALRSAPSNQPTTSAPSSTNVSPGHRRPNDDPKNGSTTTTTPRNTIGTRYTREVVDGQKRAREGDSSRRQRRREREERKRLEYLSSRSDDEHDHAHSQPHEHALSGGGGQRTHPSIRAPQPQPRRPPPQSQLRPHPRSGVRRTLSNEIELRLRLGLGLHGHSTSYCRSASSTGTSVEALIKHRHATSLAARRLTAPGSGSLVGSSGVFVVDPATKALYTTAQLGGEWGLGGEEFCVIPLSFSRQRSDEGDGDGDRDGDRDGDVDERNGNSNEISKQTVSRTTVSHNDHNEHNSSVSFSSPTTAAGTYNPSHSTPILNSSPLSAVAIAAPGCVVWATHGFHDPDAFLRRGGGGGGAAVGVAAVNAGTGAGIWQRATIHISTRYASLGVDVPWARWREDFGEWGTQTQTMVMARGGAEAGVGIGEGLVVWDARGCERGGSTNGEGRVLLGTSDGVFWGEFGGGGGGGGGGRGFEELGGMNAGPNKRGGGGRRGRGRGRESESERSREAVCVGWKDERVWLAGRRDGGVRLGDVREPGASVARLRHKGAVCRVEGMRPRCDWGVLVWGLQGSAVYDLRWTKDVAVAGDANEPYPSNKGQKRRFANKDKSLTQPLYEFDVPQARMQRQYGMGFDFDADAGVVAAAWPEALGQSRVGLWDVVTGNILDSPLEKRLYGPVPCMQYVDLEGDGNGLKTLLVGARRHGGSDGLLEAWEYEGLGSRYAG